MSILLTAALIAIATPYIFYPLILWLHALIARDPVRAGDTKPTVDLVICAHNEEAVIAKRIENALCLDYPVDRLTIWIASDGSIDGTVNIARGYANQRVRCLDFPRGGKAAALNACVAAGSADVIAFSDANSMWRNDALAKLVRSFADPRVGGVAGDQRYTEGDLNAIGERSYWSFDRWLKTWQSRAGSVISATGAIYALRRELFQPTPADATDDFMISTAVIEQGKRLVFEQEAIAVEPPASNDGEYRRKVRILTRGLRAVYYRRGLLIPSRSGFYAAQLLLHKLWRRLTWIPALLLLLATPLYMDAGTLQSLLATAMIAWALVGISGLAKPGLRCFKLVDVASYVLMVNTACAVASINVLTGRNVSHWSPTGTSVGAAP